MPVYLHALRLKNFRGIGAETQELNPFREFNFFIGANNAGKSTILDFIHRILRSPAEKQGSLVDGLDRYSGSGQGGNLAAAIGIPTQLFLERCVRSAPDHLDTIEKLANILSENGAVWFSLPLGDEKFGFVQQINAAATRKAGIEDRSLHGLWHKLTRYSGGSIQDWLPPIIQNLLSAQNITFPTIQLIPAIRQIGARSEEFTDLSGRGLIDKLAAIQSPDHDKRAERKLFEAINTFVQTVVGKHDAQIEIPHNRAHVLVHIDNKVLPLSSLGTGIHEVIMIAAFATLCEKQILCIEEPEIHLHPLLQRKLITYLRKNTTNQYFIATHSPSFIDTPGAAIFHVTNDGVQTRIKESVLRSERFQICVDLGTKASDILQANAVIWVEGPSDRIYLRNWINTVAPDLAEGIHYSIMFYGGRLLSHLTANDDEVTEFIGLRSLNQHLGIVIDSDKANASDEINETKKRLQNEFQKKPGLAWVTAGREIENYVDHDMLQAAVKVAHPNIYNSPRSGRTFDHALYFDRIDGKIEKDADKVKVARIICEQPVDLDKLDLKDRVIELVEMIRNAN